MKIRLNTDRCGSGGMQYAGDVVEIEDREAMRLIASHQAEPVEPETGALAPQRAAVLERPRLNKRGNR